MQIHRFCDYVAAHLGEGPTVYLRPKDARAIGEELIRCAANCEQIPKFSLSNYGTFTLDCERYEPHD